MSYSCLIMGSCSNSCEQCKRVGLNWELPDGCPLEGKDSIGILEYVKRHRNEVYRKNVNK